MSESKYSAQQEYLKNKRKQLRVWVTQDEYEQFREAVEKNGTSMYAVINQFIADYIKNSK